MIVEIQELNKKLETTLLAREDYSRGFNGLRASSAGDCPRLLDSLMNEPPSQVNTLDINNALRMERGTYLHLMWGKLLSEALGDDFTEEMEFSWDIGDSQPMLGHPDGYIYSLKVVYELKTVSLHTFEMVKNQNAPLNSNYLQANLYANGAIAEGREVDGVIIHYFNVNSSESLYFYMGYDESIANETLDMFRQRVINKATGTIVDRPYTDPSSSPCWFCKMKDRCYEGWSEQVENMGAASFTQESAPDLVAHVNDAINLRNVRLGSTKGEEVAKSSIASFLINRNLKAAKVDDKSISIKLGTKGNPLVTIKE